MYGDPSSPVSPGFDWATFFTWRNPLALFGGVALVPSMVLLSVAILVRASGCHQPRPLPPQTTLPLPALTLERRVVYLDPGATTTCRVYLDAHLFSPLDVHVGAIVQSQTNERSELCVEITPKRVAGDSPRTPCELRLQAHHGVGDFVVRVHACDAYQRRAEGLLQVHVQSRQASVQAEAELFP